MLLEQDVESSEQLQTDAYFDEHAGEAEYATEYECAEAEYVEVDHARIE